MLSVEKAPEAFELCYRGVPAGALDGNDSLITSDGAQRSAFGSWPGDFPGEPEWIAIADTGLARALFMIQHRPDDTADGYQVKDNDSAFASFGRAPAGDPARYSVGLLDSVDFAALESRVEFIDAAMR